MGRFIVIYSSNNLGKSTQLDLLEKFYQECGLGYTRVKYPIYESETGKLINRALRGVGEEKLEISHKDLQFVYAENRRWFEPTLVELLKTGDVIAEDYTGTGLAWGLTFGVDRESLEEFNRGLLEPDVAVLLDGERFSCGIEKIHRHESAESGVWERNREIHLKLAAEYGWSVVNANRAPETVNSEILEKIFLA